MSNHHIYKKVGLGSISKTSIEAAIQNALTEYQKAMNNMDWFEVTKTRESYR
jgi:dodecin